MPCINKTSTGAKGCTGWKIQGSLAQTGEKLNECYELAAVDNETVMKIKRSITIEFDQTTVPTGRKKKTRRWCAVCEAEGEFVDPETAERLVSAIGGQTSAVNTAELHFYHPPDAAIEICLNSIIGTNTLGSTKTNY